MWLIAAACLVTVAVSVGAQQSVSAEGAPLPDGRLLRNGTDTMYIWDGANGTRLGFAVSRIARMPDGRRLTLVFTQVEQGKPTYRIETVVDSRTLKPFLQVVTRSDTVILTLRYRTDGVIWERNTPGQSPAVSGPFEQARGVYSATVLDEVIRALPLQPGFHVELPFYYSGLQRRFNEEVSVRGSDTVRTRTGRAIDCWVVNVATEAPVGDVTFWIDKATRDLLRVTDSHERYER